MNRIRDLFVIWNADARVAPSLYSTNPVFRETLTFLRTGLMGEVCDRSVHPRRLPVREPQSGDPGVHCRQCFREFFVCRSRLFLSCRVMEQPQREGTVRIDPHRLQLLQFVLDGPIRVCSGCP